MLINAWIKGGNAKQPSALTQLEKTKVLRKLGQLIEQGYSFMQAIDIISISGTKIEHYWLNEVSLCLQKGVSLEEAFRLAKFSEYIVLIISQAEIHGNLAEAFQKAAEWNLKRIQLKREWLKVLSYPFTLLFMIGAMLYLILNFVMPQFELMFDTFGVSFSASTEYLLATYHWLTNNSTWLLTSFIVCCVCLYLVWRLPKVHTKLIPSMFRLPVLKTIGQAVHTILFSVQMGYLLQSNIPLHKCIQKLKDQTSYPLFREKMTDIEGEIMSGKTLGEAIQGDEMFTAELHPVVYYAERNGQLAQRLVQYGVYLEKESIDHWLARIKWLEPVLLIGIGGLIAYIFIALFTPMMQLMEQL